MASEYTKRELEAIRKLCEAEATSGKEETVEISLSEEEIGQMLTEAMMEQMSLSDENTGESSFESNLEQSFILRTLTGRGVMKIHWFSTPEKICW